MGKKGPKKNSRVYNRQIITKMCLKITFIKLNFDIWRQCSKKVENEMAHQIFESF